MDHLIYLFYLHYFSGVKIYERGNNMTFPKLRKNEDLINRSNFGFAGVCSHFIWIGKNGCFQKLHIRSGVKFILFDSFLGVGENLL